MEDLIQRLDTWLQNNRPTYYAQLNPGATDAEIAAFEQRLGLTLPDDVKTFYRWRNGENPGTVDHFFYFYGILSLDASYKCWLGVEQIQGENQFGPDWWQPTWVPFFASNMDDCLCIDVGGWFTGNKGQIVWFVTEESSFITNASFYTWLETYVIAFERGLFQWDEWDTASGTRPVPDAAGRYYAFERENNPGYPIEPGWDTDDE